MRNKFCSFSEVQKLTIEAIPTPLCVYRIVDTKIVTLFISDGACVFFDTSREDFDNIYNHNTLEYIHEDDRHRIFCAISSYIKNYQHKYNQIYRIKKNNKYHWIKAFGKRDSSNSLIYINYSDADNYQIQEIINSYNIEKNHSNIISSQNAQTPIGISLIEYSKKNGFIVKKISKEIPSLLGVEHNEYIDNIRKNPYIHIHPDDKPFLKNKLDTLDFSKDCNFRVIVRFFMKKINQYIHIQLIFIGIAQKNSTILLTVTYNNIEQQLQTEDKLYRIQATLNSAIKLSGISYWELDLKNNILRLISDNKKNILKERVYHNAISLIKSSHLIHKEDEDKFFSTINNFHKNIRCKKILELRLKLVDNQYHWYRLYLETSKIDTKNNSFTIIGASQNITNEVKYKEQILQVYKQNDITSFVYMPGTKEVRIVSNSKINRNIKMYYNMPYSFINEKLVHPQDISKFIKMYKNIDEGKKISKCTFRMKINNSWKWEKTIYTSVFDISGNILYAIGSSINIDREMQLKQKFEQEISLYNNSKDNTEFNYIYDITDDKIISMRNKHLSSVKLDKLNYEELINKSLKCTVDKDDILFFESLKRENLIKAYSEGKYSFKKEVKLKYKDKINWYFEKGKLIINPDNNHIIMLFVVYNVTDEKYMDEIIATVANNEFDFLAITNLNDDTYSMYSKHTRLEKNNNFFEISREHIERWIPNIDTVINAQNFTKDNIIKILSQKKVATFYLDAKVNGNYQRKKLKFFYVDENENMVVFILSDVSEIYFAEQNKNKELQNAWKKANKANQDKSVFLAQISHDLRTPLNAIISFSEFGLSEIKDNCAKKYFSEIRGSADFLYNLLTDILDLQRIEHDKMSIVNCPINADKFFINAFNMLNIKARQKRIKIDVKATSTYPRYHYADIKHAQQIIMNIFNNSVKYTPEGGKIKINFEYIKKDSNKEFINIIINDNGVGISKDFLKHIFDAYSQEQNSQSNLEGGTGIGLNITKKLVDLLGGSIRYQSEVGKGTTCYLSLPTKSISREEYTKLTTTIDIDELDFSGKKILICEDNKINQKILIKILNNKGIETDIADNGLIGVNKVKKMKYDCIFMDIRMPVMDGLSAARKIRIFDNDIPIIALSANAYEEDKIKSYAVGMNAHIAKPIIKNELFQELGKVLMDKRK